VNPASILSHSLAAAAHRPRAPASSPGRHRAYQPPSDHSADLPGITAERARPGSWNVAEAALCGPPHACCRRPLPAAPTQNPVSADCGRQNGTSPGGKPSPIPRRLLSRRVNTHRAGGADIRRLPLRSGSREALAARLYGTEQPFMGYLVAGHRLACGSVGRWVRCPCAVSSLRNMRPTSARSRAAAAGIHGLPASCGFYPVLRRHEAGRACEVPPPGRLAAAIRLLGGLRLVERDAISRPCCCRISRWRQGPQCRYLGRLPPPARRARRPRSAEPGNRARGISRPGLPSGRPDYGGPVRTPGPTADGCGPSAARRS
jgi:hypothetical protein